MNTIRGNIEKHASSTGADTTGLGRCNYADIINNKRKLLIVEVH